MKTRHRPKTKLSKLVEIVPDMDPDLIFCDMFCEPLKISEKVASFFQGFIYNSKQRVAEGDVIQWHTLRIKMPLFMDKSGDYIQDVT